MLYNDKYILVGRQIIPEPDLLKWAQWFETHNRVLKKSYLFGDIKVSTVFLGLDYGYHWLGGPPVLFETMIFGGKLNYEQWRYHTYGGALAGHKNAVKEALRSKPVSIGKKVLRNKSRHHKARFIRYLYQIK